MVPVAFSATFRRVTLAVLYSCVRGAPVEVAPPARSCDQSSVSFTFPVLDHVGMSPRRAQALEGELCKTPRLDREI
ncbi:hypothetical protein B0I37DRAFT_371843 [Chaetomium sp. MPI-CAGE-AT-0009]|nr:hypothetical protein B0I37DRAFT_371843 [Chaetomium sp. MPI-CAGE-AT-0009]